MRRQHGAVKENHLLIVVVSPARKEGENEERMN